MTEEFTLRDYVMTGVFVASVMLAPVVFGLFMGWVIWA